MAHEEEIDRRTFCRQACQAASCFALGPLLQGCGGGGGGSAPSNVPQLAAVNGSVSGNTVVVQIGSASPLAAVGGAAILFSSGGTFLVSPPRPDKVTGPDTHRTAPACPD